MAHDVFISYSHEDRTVANAVVGTLESHGIRCWIAPRDILPGSDWGAAIIDAIKEAKAMVLIFSSHSNDSDQIKREVERTVHQGIAVIPFRIEDVLPSKTLEYFISTQHWLDALTPPLEDHLAHLAETIRVLLAKKGEKEKPQAVEIAAPAVEKPPEAATPQVQPAVQPVSEPLRKFPVLWVSALVGLLAALALAGGLWWRYSRPVVATKEAPAPAPSPPPAPLPPATLSATEYFNQGLEAKEPDKKIEFYTKAIAINSYNPQYYYYRGLAYKAKALFPLAIEDFTRAINYQPNYPSAYASRAETYSSMGQQDQAIADYTKAISLEPRNATYFLNRGIAQYKKGDNDKAVEDYSEAIRLKPNYARAFNNRGAIYYRKGENDKALADYNDAIRLDPNYVLALRNRANLFDRLGDKEKATADRDRAKALDPKGLVRGI